MPIFDNPDKTQRIAEADGNILSVWQGLTKVLDNDNVKMTIMVDEKVR